MQDGSIFIGSSKMDRRTREQHVKNCSFEFASVEHNLDAEIANKSSTTY